jgi:hypothetical protein
MARVGSASSPSFSPDGRSLAFVSNLSGVPQVWTVPVEGGWPELVTPLDDPVGFVEWAAEGSWLAFTVAPGGGMNQQVYLSLPDGSGLRRLTAGGKETNSLAGWTRDGRTLRLGSNVRTGSSVDAYLYDPSTGTARARTSSPGMNLYADVNRDGSLAVALAPGEPGRQQPLPGRPGRREGDAADAARGAWHLRRGSVLPRRPNDLPLFEQGPRHHCLRSCQPLSGGQAWTGRGGRRARRRRVAGVRHRPGGTGRCAAVERLRPQRARLRRPRDGPSSAARLYRGDRVGLVFSHAATARPHRLRGRCTQDIWISTGRRRSRG